MRKKIKKLIVLILIASILATSYPIISGQTVKADAIGVGEFSRIFSSLSGALGSTPKGSGSKFWGNMMDMYGHSYDIWCKQYADLNDKVQSWNNLLLQDVRTFTDYMIRSFPHFLQDVKDGQCNDILDDIEDIDGNFVSYQKLRSSLTSSKSLQWSVDDSLRQYCINSKSQLVNVPTELTNLEISKYTLTSKIASLKEYYSDLKFERGFVCRSGTDLNTYVVEQNTGMFYFYDSTKQTLKVYGDTLVFGKSQFDSSGNYLRFIPYKQKGNIYISFDKSLDNIIPACNAVIDYYTDGSFIIRDSNDMTKVVFDTIQNSLFDQITKNPATSIEDWAIADEHGKTIDDPTSQILDKIYDNMLTADDLKALENGDTSVLEKLQGISAVNEKTGETVGDIKEDVNDAVGILGAIKLIGKRIFARQLSLINLVKNLAKGKWTSVIDNVGDLTLPIVKSIDSIGQVVSSLSSMKWVIDNVGDICNPIGTAIDTMNGNIANVFSGIGNAILNAIDNIEIPSLTDVIDNIKAVPTSIVQSLTNVVDNIKAIPNTVATCIADLFVPTSDDLTSLKTYANSIIPSHFGISANELNISIEEREFSDVKYKDNVIVEANTLNSGINSIRPVVQGLCWFGLILFVVNQILQLFDKKGVGEGDSD